MQFIVCTIKKFNVVCAWHCVFDSTHVCSSLTALQILGAAYGPRDVTSDLSRRVTSSGQLTVKPSNGVFGDPWGGVKKTLVVVYKHSCSPPRIAIAREHYDHQLHISAKPLNFYNCFQERYSRHGLNIVGAAYGLKDVTDKVRSLVHHNRLSIRASNYMFGDSYPGVRKTLIVVYRYGYGRYRTKIVKEDETIHIWTTFQIWLSNKISDDEL